MADLASIIQNLKQQILSLQCSTSSIPFPKFSQLKSSKDEYYSKYSEALSRYNELCDCLSNLQYTSVVISRILREISNTPTETYSQKTLYATELRNLKEECIGLIDCYKTLKESSEQLVRFYSSLQYVITSYRFEADSHAVY